MRATKRGSATPRCGPWVWLALLTVALLAGGCQFIQNEFWTY